MVDTIDDAIAEAVQVVLGLTPDELTEFARQVAMANSAQADRLADVLIDAVYDAQVAGGIAPAFQRAKILPPVIRPDFHIDYDDYDYLPAMAQ